MVDVHYYITLRSNLPQLFYQIKALYYIDSDFHSVEVFDICLGALPLQVDNFFNNGISTKAPYSRRQLEDCQAHH